MLSACLILIAYVTKYNTTGIMANGQRTHVGAIACPRDIPLGAHAIIGGKEYVCSDRTAKIYNGRFDIYDPRPTKELIKWGKKKEKVIIF